MGVASVASVLYSFYPDPASSRTCSAGSRIGRVMAVDLLQRLGMTSPVVQAGMGGRLSRHELAAAVSEAGGLGTIHGRDARLAEEIAAARRLTGRPVAVNILLPFARPAQWRAARAADAVVTFWGSPRRRHAGVWIHQC